VIDHRQYDEQKYTKAKAEADQFLFDRQQRLGARLVQFVAQIGHGVLSNNSIMAHHFSCVMRGLDPRIQAGASLFNLGKSMDARLKAKHNG